MSNYKYISGAVILGLKRNLSYYAGDIVDLLEGKDMHIKSWRKKINNSNKHENNSQLVG